MFTGCDNFTQVSMQSMWPVKSMSSCRNYTFVLLSTASFSISLELLSEVFAQRIIVASVVSIDTFNCTFVWFSINDEHSFAVTGRMSSLICNGH